MMGEKRYSRKSCRGEGNTEKGEVGPRGWRAVDPHEFTGTCYPLLLLYLIIRFIVQQETVLARLSREVNEE
jgi:hypothetical protein